MASDSPSRAFQRSPRTPRLNQLTNPPTTASNLSRTINHPSNLRTGPSPAYTTNLRSRHSLYGTDDRVILDLGSKVWKAGFSSETNPRVVISVHELCKPILGNIDSIWNISSNSTISLVSDAISIGLTRIFFNHLMIDPKQRKVILIENPLIPTSLRSEIAIALFDQLHVPSIAFTPSPVLTLMACGILTGLVVDVGNLETSVIPVYMSRPLFPMIKSTTRAGSRLSARLSVLLSRFAQYLIIPKFGQSSLSTSNPRITKPTHIPPGLLTPAVVEDIKTRLLFVSQDKLQLDNQSEPIQPLTEQAEQEEGQDNQGLEEDYSESNNHQLLDTLERIYRRSTSPDTQDVVYKLPAPQPSQSNPRPPCIGVIRVPGWMRERASEILFNPTLSSIGQIEEEEDESLSIPEIILECLLKLPIDLRRPIVRNLIVSGGGAMLPGFLGRLKSELIHTLEEFHVPPPSTDQMLPKKARKQQEVGRWLASRRKFSPLHSLSHDLEILNHFEASSSSSAPVVRSSATSTTNIRRSRPPQFQMNLLAWIGGSLAGSMKIGGQEVIRERWDSVVESSLVTQELDLHHLSPSVHGIINLDELDEDEDNEEQIEYQRKLIGLKIASAILPDWAALSLN
ncbi:hypothetical protein PTTG_05497 [Puccinia triticina 1-1 BBBD Race 1]|uniref:Actin-related protein 10 n=2 Tax=Puccinia triticina TaxID=208348 RepID=A0A180GRI8_PUCT1|nr:uncharacterized protein PtA15_16A14 [Puccinia triticina]OAV94999.1 hypothetical protein PTTG_05497 [Puccinia triticina 1-1 BBBD Race 1]WAQ92109.1 hypothetical protein PtA15_16A14 [Puccinia triticina]WAR63855.1 hypothetical protein PtB15_16B14 [Puccinia triticina]